MNTKSKWIKIDEDDWHELNKLRAELAKEKGGTWFMKNVIKELIAKYQGVDDEEEG